MATSTERSRRSRAHGKGDHSACLAGRPCRPDLPLPSKEDKTPFGRYKPPASAELGPRGRSLWEDAKDDFGPGHRELLYRACHVLDRLEEHDRVLSGPDESLFRVVQDRDGRHVLVLHPAFAESRKDERLFVSLCGELRRAAGPRWLAQQA